MYKVGITGGIGSGKSTICHFFELLGIPVFFADQEAKKVMAVSPVIRYRLMAMFGKDIYRPDQTLDRKKLADLIFNSPTLLRQVNAVVHPEVRKYFLKWAVRQTAPYVVQEAAILFESGFYQTMDCNVMVTAPQEMRISRVMARDQVSREEVMQRISGQWPDEQKEKLADHIIRNDNRELIIPQLIELDKKFKIHG